MVSQIPARVRNVLDGYTLVRTARPFIGVPTIPNLDTSNAPTAPRGYNNRSIWLRFLRVLAEGSDTFHGDGNGEDVGLTFDGLGLKTAAQVFYDALLEVSESSTPIDLAEMLVAAAADIGKTTEMRYALGIAGFPPATWGMARLPCTDRTPRGV